MGLFPKDRNLAVAPDRVELEVRGSDFGLRPAEVEIRLDAFLQRHLHWRSRTSIQRLIRDGFVLVDPASPDVAPEARRLETARRAALRLRHGARVAVVIPEELRVVPRIPTADDLTILYEDEDFLAVDKPPFLPVHPSGRHLTDTLIQRVHARYLGDGEGGRVPVRLCHRLDRETSGVVLCGKNEAAHRAVMRQFERRQTEKEYLAVVHGEPRDDGGLIDLALGPARASRVHLKIAVQVDGLPSRTEWTVVERRRGFALLSCRPLTGRQHQIRVHLEAIGHPVVGDKLYGGDEGLFLRNVKGELDAADRAALRLERHALHNHRLAWRSPRDGARREVVSPLAPDLRAFLDGLTS